jgi:hypothetical protein
MKTLIEMYVDILKEGKGNIRSHSSKGFDEIIKISKELGCEVNDGGGNVVKITPPRHVTQNLPVSLRQYTAHRGEQGIHPLRRYLKNYCKFNDPRLKD